MRAFPTNEVEAMKQAVVLIVVALAVGVAGCKKPGEGKCEERVPKFVLDSKGNQVKHGLEWGCWPDGKWELVRQFRYGKAYGRVTWWYKNGRKKTEGEWRAGKLQGKGFVWYKNGRKAAEGEWRDSKRHGKWTDWHPNGKKSSEGEYRHDKPCGRWRCWDKQGRAKGSGLSSGGCRRNPTGATCPPCAPL